MKNRDTSYNARFVKPDAPIWVINEKGEDFDFSCPNPVLIHEDQFMGPEDEDCDDPNCAFYEGSYVRIAWSKTEQAVISCDDINPKVMFSEGQLLEPELH
jgi:hypothetical protein